MENYSDVNGKSANGGGLTDSLPQTNSGGSGSVSGGTGTQISTTVSAARQQNGNGSVGSGNNQLKAKRFQRNNLNRYDPTGQHQQQYQMQQQRGLGNQWQPQQDPYNQYMSQQQQYGLPSQNQYDPYEYQQAYAAAAMYGQPQPSYDQHQMYDHQQQQQLLMNEPESPKGGHVVYVYGIGQRATQQEVTSLFQPFGRVLRVDIIIDFNTGLCKGYAFVSMERFSDAQMAVQNLNRMPFHGRQLQVRFKTTTA